ncbi:PREDICTED: uncharacterized protein LOC109223076 [Nicotiana attenuata]|uniref:RING-type domain-containing protein n=1 Tax=Nicotiana attenuata TaxID=49451 RepID=A0A1J6J2C8_NICAT|nr:PREDICTED: uncharacterized protein LOC109223076 [Nicotiana attenuata]XP_019242881.1 PREDICTED: uncharacterized protein LOC109223076 [Nicotiana attenuata]OIT06888.1 hypothetical protein A4A49_03217 [Nicotiana attenuata]
MDSITTTPVPASDIPIQQGNNRTMSRRLSARFPSSKDATYPDDIVNEFGQSPLSGSRRGMDPGTRSRTLNRNSSRAQRGSASARFDPSMSMRGSNVENDDEYEEESAEEGEETSKEGEEPVRMSLMALLAESEGSSYMMGEDEDEDEDDGGGDVGGGENNSCCVCMVRHKGAAFVPCGHSFCRLCSRELWVEGGNCPLCNNFILEILDIF